MNFLEPPSWAYNACYYSLGLFALYVAYSVWQIIVLYRITKSPAATGMAGGISLVGLAIVGFMSFMSFWVCRGALKP
jgi:hypothetical protein